MMRNLMILMACVVGLAMAPAAMAQSQILIIDNDRVENEAAAYKDFNLQTAEVRDGILQLRRMLAQGGALEQRAAELEQQKAISGAEKYEQDLATLQQEYQTYQRQLQILELTWDRLREEALRQVERARQPVFRTILANRNAQIILPKSLVLGNAAGIDVTTEFIELLDVELNQVSLPTLDQARANQNNSQPAANDSGVEEID